MNIVVTCTEDQGYKRSVEVHQLQFNEQTQAFNMYYCWGDMWDIELKCPLEIVAISVASHTDEMAVQFDQHDAAEAFVAWLIEGEEKVQHGFKTMRD